VTGALMLGRLSIVMLMTGVVLIASFVAFVDK
jgi:hypothetical protein